MRLRMLVVLALLVCSSCAHPVTTASGVLQPPSRPSDVESMQFAAEEETILYHSQWFTSLPGESTVFGRIPEVQTDLFGPPLDVLQNASRALIHIDANLAISSIQGRLVGEDGEEVPATEVFLHHWILRNGRGTGPMGCWLQMRWVFAGGGDTSSSHVFTSPDGYAYVTRPEENWSFELHAMDLRDVAPENLKACYECACFGGLGGGLACCPNGSRCPTTGSTTSLSRPWRLQLKVQARRQLASTSDASTALAAAESRHASSSGPGTGVTSLMMLNIATSGHLATSEEAPYYEYMSGSTNECLFEYDLSAYKDILSSSVDNVYVQYAEWDSLPFALSLVGVSGHMHVGALNMTLEVDGVPVCTVFAAYAGGAAAYSDINNPSPFITSLSSCQFSPPLEIPEGARVRTYTAYDVQHPRLAVMSYLYLAAVEQPGLLYGNPTTPSGDQWIPLSLASRELQPTVFIPSSHSWARECCICYTNVSGCELEECVRNSTECMAAQR